MELNSFDVSKVDVAKGFYSGVIGKKVIVRSHVEGINSGIVVAADASGVVISDARRLWYHAPENRDVAWYEGVALTGVDKSSKLSCVIPFKVIVENYSLTLLTDRAWDSIMAAPSHKSNG